MSRARGANAVMALAFANTYGAIPGSGFMKMPFVSNSLGEEQGLIESDLLGYGREPLPPSDDVVSDEGDVVVALDLRRFGVWLKMMFGPPVTTQGVAATGGYTFSAQPVNNAILTVNGQAITFVTGAPAANQVKIGATLKATLQNAVWALNASAVAGVMAASYGLNLAGDAIGIIHKTIGTSGNSFTTVAGTTPATNAVAGGATLLGGLATGPYNHVFSSGSLTLPDAAIEIGSPDVPSFSINYGVLLDKMSIALQRSGNLNATLSLVAQGETPAAPTTSAGSPTEVAIERFNQFAGLITLAGVPLGEVVSGKVSIANNLEKAENIRPDGRIDGADGATFSAQPELVVRFADQLLLDLAIGKVPVDLAYGWSIGPGKSLTFRTPNTRLPRPKKPITGPGGIQATFAGMASKDPVLGKTMIATLVNDIPAY